MTDRQAMMEVEYYPHPPIISTATRILPLLPIHTISHYTYPPTHPTTVTHIPILALMSGR